jgi:hypothetical protein
MASITADKTLKEYLLRAKEVTAIRDACGEVLGYYAPAAVADHVPAVRLLALFDREELKRRKASTHLGYTFDQVKEHLRSLEETA